MISRNRFWLFSFQITNWSGGLLLYTALLYTVPAKQASAIFSAEALLGALGIFFTNLFLRAHLSHSSEKLLFQARVTRLIIAVGITALFSLGYINIEFFCAAFAVLVTPVHLPILFGFSPVHTIFAAYKLVTAALLIANDSSHFSLNIAVIYFAPTMAYGASLWCYENWASRTRENDQSKPLPADSSPNMASQIFVTVTACWAQSLTIPSIVAMGPTVAAIERSMRSAASFLYPHIALKILKSSTIDHWLVVISTTLLVFLIATTSFRNMAWLAALFFLPTAVDLVNSLVAGKKWVRDCFLGCGFALFIWTLYV